MSEQVARLDFREAEGRREGTRIAIDPARLWHKLDELLALLNARYHLRSAEWLSSRVTLYSAQDVRRWLATRRIDPERVA